MENAVDALIMAAQVLMFIIALTVSMSSFSTLREGIDNVLGYTETLDMARNEEGYVNYIQAKDGNEATIRIVGVETVVASLYRAIKEDYVIYMIFKNTDWIDIYPYNIITENCDGVVTYVGGKLALKFTIGYKNDGINQDVNTMLRKDFYNIIRNMKFKEYLGEYQEASEPGVTSENKMTNRIITFEQM